MIEINQVRATNIIGPTNIPSGDFCCNPYIGCAHGCMYCYAQFMNRFAGHDIPWGSYVDVKNWPDMSPDFIAKLKNKTIIFGSVTDCYQPAEAEFHKTRAVLRQLQGSGAKPLIITKSDLVLQDMDLIASFPGATVAFSINTLDETFRRDMDRAMPIERRIKAMHAFYHADVRTVTFISPIFPEITNIPDIVNMTRNQCDAIWLENLNLRFGFRGKILDYIAKAYPQYDRIYRGLFTDLFDYDCDVYWENFMTATAEYAAREGLPLVHGKDPGTKGTRGYPTMVTFFHTRKRKTTTRKSTKRGALKS